MNTLKKLLLVADLIMSHHDGPYAGRQALNKSETGTVGKSNMESVARPPGTILYL